MYQHLKQKVSRMKVAVYNCKRCKVGNRVAYPEMARSHIGYGRYEVSRWRIGERGQRIYPGASLVSGTTYEGDGACPNCRRVMTWGWLEGFKVETVPCDVRCTSARGFKCDCSCGGENHGSDWSGLGKPMKELLSRPEGDVSGAQGSRCEHILPAATV
jgi:hypothetical protein